MAQPSARGRIAIGVSRPGLGTAMNPRDRPVIHLPSIVREVGAWDDEHTASAAGHREPSCPQRPRPAHFRPRPPLHHNTPWSGWSGSASSGAATISDQSAGRSVSTGRGDWRQQCVRTMRSPHTGQSSWRSVRCGCGTLHRRLIGRAHIHEWSSRARPARQQADTHTSDTQGRRPSGAVVGPGRYTTRAGAERGGQ